MGEIAMSETRVPAALLSAVKHDMRPVRPLASPAHRALVLLPLGLVLLIAMPAFWIWQGHAKLAPGSSWGMSAIEIGLSMIILAAGFREAIPGRELSDKELCALGVAACGGFLLVNSLTQTPAPVSAETWMRWLTGCIFMTICFSIPALLAPAGLVARALPNRPALAGALYGMGVGLMADAGLRFICSDGGFAHVLLSHGGAIVLLVALGALCATALEQAKVLARRRRS
jgi:hypothetical protein